jgi:hypothetical protein
MTTRADIINRALIEIGATPMQSEAVPPGDAYVLQYETHIGLLVSCYPWTFQTELRQLARLAAPAEAQWAFMYELPPDMKGAPRAVYPTKDSRRPTQDYELRNGRLYADHPQVWLRYTVPANPVRWPAYFLSLAVLAMKAQFALSVREDSSLWRTLTEQLYGPAQMMGEGGMLGQAKSIDAGGKPSDVLQIASNPLVAVRH